MHDACLIGRYVILIELQFCTHRASILTSKLRTNGCELNLVPDMVAEAFASIGDPLVIVSLENGSLRVHGPFAMYVDLKKSREEITSALFPNSGQKNKAVIAMTTAVLREDNHHVEEHRNGDHSVEKQSSKVNIQNVKIKKGSLSTLTSVLVDGENCGGEDTTLQTATNSWDDLKQPSFAFNMSQTKVDILVSDSDETSVESLQSSKGMVSQSVTDREWKVKKNVCLDSSNMMEETGDENNIQESRSKNRRKSKKNKSDTTLNALPTVVLDRQPCAQKDTTLQEARNSWDDLTSLQEENNSWDDLEQPSSASDTRSDESTMQRFVERGESSRGMMDGFFMKTGQEWKVKQKMGLDFSNNNSQDSGINIEMGNSTRQKSKKNSQTLQEVNNSWDDLKQPSFASSNMSGKKTAGDRVQSSKGMVGGFLSRPVIGQQWKVVEKVGSESSDMTEDKCDEEHINGGQSELETETNIDNTHNVEIKKGEEKKMKKWIKKNKGTKNGDSSSVESVLEKQTIYKKTQDVEIKKGKGNNMEKWVKKNKESNNLNTFTCDEHEHGNENHSLLQEENHVKETDDKHRIGNHSPLEILLEKESNDDDIHNEENKKRKGKFIAREDTSMCETNSTCNDLNLSSSAFDMGLVVTLTYQCYLLIIIEKAG
ncbi:hypothetical protein LXL04_022437 [Taraxacum kok-saghyz]